MTGYKILHIPTTNYLVVSIVNTEHFWDFALNRPRLGLRRPNVSAGILAERSFLREVSSSIENHILTSEIDAAKLVYAISLYADKELRELNLYEAVKFSKSIANNPNVSNVEKILSENEKSIQAETDSPTKWQVAHIESFKQLFRKNLVWSDIPCNTASDLKNLIDYNCWEIVRVE